MDYSSPNITEPVTSDKILMGSGPANLDERVMKALSGPIMSHIDPNTLQIMDDVKDGLKYLFQTENIVTICISGTGHSAMEASLCNLIEDGEVVLVALAGYWGMMGCDMAERYGADVRQLTPTSGTIFTLQEIEEQLIIHNPVALFIAQGETSTGILQPMEGIGELCRKYDCLLIVDAVASLGGVPFFTDRWLVDVAFTAGQKAVGAVSGLSPITFSQRAMQKINNRKTKIKVYYWDVTILVNYWNCFGRPRMYHHTISSPLLCAMREALRIIADETLPVRFARLEECTQRLESGIEALGLEMFVKEPKHRLQTVQLIRVPDGVDLYKVSKYVIDNYNILISPGMGPTLGLVWRIGLMGMNTTVEKVELILHALAEGIRKTSNYYE